MNINEAFIATQRLRTKQSSGDTFSIEEGDTYYCAMRSVGNPDFLGQYLDRAMLFRALAPSSESLSIDRDKGGEEDV